MYINTANALTEFKTSTCRSIAGRIRKVCDNESGATAIEYGLMIAAIGVAIIGIVFLLGADLAAFYEGVHEKLADKKECTQAGQNCGNQ